MTFWTREGITSASDPRCSRRQSRKERRHSPVLHALTADALGIAFQRLTRGLKLANLRFHDSRHDVASTLTMAGVPQRTVMEILGHKDPRVTLRYQHLSPNHLRGAIRELEITCAEPDRASTFQGARHTGLQDGNRLTPRISKGDDLRHLRASMQYLIQKRIYGLVEITLLQGPSLRSFTGCDIQFSPWDTHLANFARNRFWLAESQIESSGHDAAWKTFHENFSKITSRIAFIGQAYLEANAQPFLLKRTDSEVALFRHSTDRGGVPLCFGEEQLQALNSLLNNADVPQEFYYYWHEATNTFGYSAKLVLMFAGLEALFGKDREAGKPQYYKKLEFVFGQPLTEELYGTRNQPHLGLRQRLVHGEYLGPQDVTKNYVEEIHKRIIEHFNTHVLGQAMLTKDVTNPQRHPFGNIDAWKGWVRSTAGKPLDLKNVLQAFEANFDNPEGYEIVDSEEVPQPY